MAMLLPVVVLVLLMVVQAGLFVRDRVVVVHATRVAARAVIVDPTAGAARDAVRAQVAAGAGAHVSVGGELRAGGYAVVTVSLRVTPVPIVGRVVSGVRVQERLTVYVEGAG